MAVGTHWPTTCDVCGHVLPGQMHELRRGTCWWTGFQPPRREQNVQFRRFLYGACDSVCNTIRSPFAIKLGPDVQEWKFSHQLWTSISDARICKRCSVNQTSFHIPTVYSHFSLIFPRFLACGLQCALRRIGDRSAGGSVPIPSQLDRARTRFSTKIGSITSIM